MTFSGEYVGLKMTLFEIKLKFYQNDTFRDQGELWPTKTVPFGIKVKFGTQNFTFWASEIKITQTPPPPNFNPILTFGGECREVEMVPFKIKGNFDQ